MNWFNKFLGWIFFFAMQAAYDTFLIWGLVTYGEVGTFISDKTTIILLSVPTLIAINLLLAIPAGLFFNSMFKKKEKKGFEIQKKFSGWFGRDKATTDFDEDQIENWFKENITEEKIEKWFKEKFGENME